MTVKKEIETRRRSQEKSENSFADTKAELKAMNSRMNNAEDRTNDLLDRMEITQSKKKQKNESSKRDLWDNIKCAHLHTVGIPEGEEREKGIENVSEEIMAENVPNLKKDTDIQGQEA